MRRLLLLSFMMICTMLAAEAQTLIDGIWYNLSVGAMTAEVTSTKNAEYEGDIVVPEQVTCGSEVYTVTGIADNAFYFCKDVTSVTLPSTVTRIGHYAFARCQGLSSMELPEGLTDIGMHAFEYCMSMASVNLPSTTKIIGNMAFWCCTRLGGITIPRSVKTISTNAFATCYFKKDSFVNQSTVRPTDNNPRWGFLYYDTETEDGLLLNGSELVGTRQWEAKQVVIPPTVTSIGSGAFVVNTDLSVLTIPESVTSIASNAFANCIMPKANFVNRSACRSERNWGAKLYDKETEEGLLLCGDTVVGVRNYNITTATIPAEVTSIGSSAFFGCAALTSIKIPDSVTSIGVEAFWGCGALTGIEIPASITSIGENAFFQCYFSKGKLQNNSACQSPSNWGAAMCEETEDGLVIENSALAHVRGNVASVVVPEGVTAIYSDAFYGKAELTSVVIPNSVTNLSDLAFENCPKLKTVTIGSSVMSMESYFYGSFFRCSNIENLIFAEGCKKLVPTRLTMVQTVTIPSTATGVETNAFKNFNSVRELIFAEGTTNIIKTGITSIVSVSLPCTVTYIKTSAFADCRNLKSITLPASVNRIGSSAFKNCIALTEVCCQSKACPEVQTNTFTNVDLSACTLYVPQSAVEEYRNAEVWKDFGTILPIGETAIQGVNANHHTSSASYTLSGRKADDATRGIVIRNGRKVVK